MTEVILSHPLQPGRRDSVEKGCTCPVLDNAHGQGNEGQFWISAGCPLHGRKPKEAPND